MKYDAKGQQCVNILIFYDGTFPLNKVCADKCCCRWLMKQHLIFVDKLNSSGIFKIVSCPKNMFK